MSVHVWIVKTPRGRLIPETCALSHRDAEGALFHFIAAANERYRAVCWKDWAKGQRVARSMGFKIVRCRLVETGATG